MEYITEAVFANGKQKMRGIEEQFRLCKEELDRETKEDSFDPMKYWRQDCWKTMEDEIQKTFGFRSVQVMPWNEKYDKKTKKFETREMSVEVSYHRRYPIEGLVTDNGFYDKSHSIAFTVTISLGAVQQLSPGELTACMLHEFGHVIDPAIMDIHYTEANVLAKYMTDREKSVTNDERKALHGKKFVEWIGSLTIAIGFGLIYGVMLHAARNVGRLIGVKIGERMQEKQRQNPERDKRVRESMKKIEEKLKKDAETNRRTNEEAYADDFARMYGYGPQLGSALMKIYGNTEDEIKSRLELERDRQRAIASMFVAALDDSHKTDVQRIKALIKEYHKDINDPNTPANVKKQLEADVGELEKVLDEYLNHFDALTNRINKMIAKEIDLQDVVDQEPEKEDKKEEEPIKEEADPLADTFEENGSWNCGDVSFPFFEKAKHPVKQKIQRFKQRYHYHEKMVTTDNGAVKAGVITVDGNDYILANDQMEPVCLTGDLRHVGDAGDMTDPTEKRIHLSYTTLTKRSDKDTHVILMHEIGHCLQYNDDSAGKRLNAYAHITMKRNNVDTDSIHGNGMEEIDADIHAARNSKDPDAIIKAIKRLYRESIKKNELRKSLKPMELPPEQKKMVQEMVEKEYQKNVADTKAAAANGNDEAKQLLAQPISAENEMLVAAAQSVSWDLFIDHDINITSIGVLWNIPKYHAMIFRSAKKSLKDAQAAGDIGEREKALKAVKKAGLKNGIEGLLKSGKPVTVEDLIHYFEEGLRASTTEDQIEHLKRLCQKELSMPLKDPNNATNAAKVLQAMVLELSSWFEWNGELKKAKRELQQILDDYPKDYKPQGPRDPIYRRKKDQQETVERVTNELKIHNDNLTALMRQLHAFL